MADPRTIPSSLSPGPTLPGLRVAIPLEMVLEWPWLRPLHAILAVQGWSLHEVINDRQKAWLVRACWKLLQESIRVSRAREEELDVLERLWAREQGAPIPCPLCQALEPCACEPTYVHTTPRPPGVGFTGSGGGPSSQWS